MAEQRYLEGIVVKNLADIEDEERSLIQQCIQSKELKQHKDKCCFPIVSSYCTIMGFIHVNQKLSDQQVQQIAAESKQISSLIELIMIDLHS